VDRSRTVAGELYNLAGAARSRHPGSRRTLLHSVTRARGPEFGDFVLAQLSRVVPATGGAMFGSVGTDSRGLSFALIANDDRYLKVDEIHLPVGKSTAVARAACGFRPTPLPGVARRQRERLEDSFLGSRQPETDLRPCP
jgi:hypothetical protein